MGGARGHFSACKLCQDQSHKFHPWLGICWSNTDYPRKAKEIKNFLYNGTSNFKDCEAAQQFCIDKTQCISSDEKCGLEPSEMNEFCKSVNGANIFCDKLGSCTAEDQCKDLSKRDDLDKVSLKAREYFNDKKNAKMCILKGWFSEIPNIRCMRLMGDFSFYFSY